MFAGRRLLAICMVESGFVAALGCITGRNAFETLEW